MLSNSAKIVIKDLAEQQYNQIYKNKDRIQIGVKINNFNNFIEVYKDDPDYGEQITAMAEDFERLASNNRVGQLLFEKVGIIKSIVDIVVRAIGKNQLPVQDYKTVNLMMNQEVYLDALKACDGNLANEQNQNNGIIGFAPTYWGAISNVLISYLEITYKIHDIIMDKVIDKQININNYLKKIIDKYESKINFKYIPSSVIKISNIGFQDEEDYANDETPFIEINEDENLRKIKLIGYAGVGKSTTLEYIEYQDAVNYEKNKKIPVIISLISVEEDTSMYNLIAKKLGLPDEVEENKEKIDYLIEKGKINLYIDGVNEINITNPQEKRTFTDKIEDFISQKITDNIKIIATDRDNNEVSILNNTNTFLIQGMTKQNIEDFIEGNVTKPEKINEIKKAILDNENFKEKTIHPIMIKNLITVIETKGEIPENSLDELDDLYLETLIDREKVEKQEPLAEYIEELLKYLVIEMNESKKATSIALGYFDILEIIKKFAEKNNYTFSNSAMLTLLTKMGILKEVEFERYAFADEAFYHTYYHKLSKEGKI